MPAQISHYLQSMLVCDELGIADQYRDAVALGAMGPDVLFYYKRLSGGMGVHNLATLLHTTNADKLFSTFAEYLVNNPKDVYAHYYAYGFICHFALDKTAHPYVYYLQDEIVEREKFKKNPFFIHARIEHTLDVIMLERLKNETVGQFHPATCVPKDEQARAAAVRVLSFVANTLYPDVKFNYSEAEKSFRHSRKYLWLATDRTGLKRPAVKTAETVCFMKNTLSALIHPPQPDGLWDYPNENKTLWTNYSTGAQCSDSFYEMFDNSQTLACTLIKKFAERVRHGDCNVDFTGGYDMKGRKNNNIAD